MVANGDAAVPGLLSFPAFDTKKPGANEPPAVNRKASPACGATSRRVIIARKYLIRLPRVSADGCICRGGDIPRVVSRHHRPVRRQQAGQAGYSHIVARDIGSFDRRPHAVEGWPEAAEAGRG